MDLGLKDKVVVVTGGAKGIGAATVRACAEEGAIPVIVDRDVESGASLQNEIDKRAVRSGLVAVDLMSADNCARAIELVVEKFGGLDALVNNAGRNDKVGLEHGNPVQYVESLNRNLVHYYS